MKIFFRNPVVVVKRFAFTTGKTIVLIIAILFLTFSAGFTTADIVSYPAITKINPSSGTVGGEGFTLEVSGHNFTPDSIVFIDNLKRATEYISSTLLKVTMLKSDLKKEGELSITVYNLPSPSLIPQSPVPTPLLPIIGPIMNSITSTINYFTQPPVVIPPTSSNSTPTPTPNPLSVY